MRIAIIDMGTNTFHLLIVEVAYNGTYQIIEKIKTAVKLGKNGMSNATITPASFWRGLKTMKSFQKKANAQQVEKIYAFGTSAVRNANNGPEFIAQVFEKTGIQIEAISGEQEAEYIYYGVRQALSMGADKSLIMDIGGGSVEFVIANNKEVFWKKSYEIGAARLLEHFNPSNPITSEEIQSLETYLNDAFIDLYRQTHEHQIKTLIGSSGSFDTFADLIAAKEKISGRISERALNYHFNISDYLLIHTALINSTAEKRKKMKGMIAMRVDMIVVASVMVNLILKQLNIQQMMLSTYALKEGVLWKIIQDSKLN